MNAERSRSLGLQAGLRSRTRKGYGEMITREVHLVGTRCGFAIANTQKDKQNLPVVQIAGTGGESEGTTQMGALGACAIVTWTWPGSPRDCGRERECREKGPRKGKICFQSDGGGKGDMVTGTNAETL